MRCVARKGSDNFSFIHIFSGDSKKGWSSFLNMIKDFLLIHKYEQWHFFLQHDLLKMGSRLLVKNLPLNLGRKVYFRGLEEIVLDTLNLIDCSEARIQVRICGFLPATSEIKNTLRASFFLNFGDI